MPEYPLHSIWLGLTAYDEAEALQRCYEADRRAGTCEDTLLLLEHPHVYTMGRSATADDILVSEDWLDSHQVELQRTDRGGQVTYHGPGQLVGYLIMDIKRRRWSVPRFVWLVEEALRLWLQGEGLEVQRVCNAPGLWHQDAKIASIGFHMSRGISRHGFAINVQPDLRFYDGIIACGRKDPVASLQSLLGREYNIEQSAAEISEALNYVFSTSSSATSDSSSKTETSSPTSASSERSLR